MSCRHKHVAKNHQIAKKIEIGPEIAKVRNGGHRVKMLTNGPHQCVRQPQNRGGGACAENLKKMFFGKKFHWSLKLVP